MNAAELIEYIRTAEKKTPVKVYIWERFPTSFPNAKIFPAGDGAKIVFGDWRDIGPAIEAQQDAIARGLPHRPRCGRRRRCGRHIGRTA